METRGESIANVTYSAPTETGEVQTTDGYCAPVAGRSAVPGLGETTRAHVAVARNTSSATENWLEGEHHACEFSCTRY
jgi:hypothetical protein